jgi:hypothetical protein
MWSKVVVSAVLAFLATFSPGCVHDTGFKPPVKPTVVMHGDESFSKEERAFIEEAAGIWSKQTDGLATIRFVWDYIPGDIESEANHATDHVVIKHTSYEPSIMERDCEISRQQLGLPRGLCLQTLLAWVSPSGGFHGLDDEDERVTLNFIPDRYEGRDRWVSVAIHEMGHVLGLPHSTFRHAVMFPTNDVSKTCLRQPDLQAFCSANVCEGHTMKPCGE